MDGEWEAPLIGMKVYEQQRDKTCLRVFQPGPTQSRLYSHRRWLEV